MLSRLCLLGCLLFSTSAAIAESSDTEALSKRVSAYAAAMQSKSYEGIIDVVPTRILSMMAGLSDTDVATLKAAMIQQTQQAIATIDVLEFEIDTRNPDYKRTSNDVPFVFLPTAAVMAVPGVGKVESSTSTLALKDGGEWFLSAIDSPQQIAIIRQAYPGFSSIDFPSGTSKPAE
ncbi:MAG: hypothetical protein AAGC81_12305 [Pseudomonadota bacterium]